jgi:hypothetical protein
VIAVDPMHAKGVSNSHGGDGAIGRVDRPDAALIEVLEAHRVPSSGKVESVACAGS